MVSVSQSMLFDMFIREHAGSNGATITFLSPRLPVSALAVKVSARMAGMNGWLRETFGCDVPVVGAPMAGASGGELAAAISSGGGLGMIGAGAATTPEWITVQAARAAAAGRPYGIGLMAWVLEKSTSQLDALIQARPALAAISFGQIAPFAQRLRAEGILVATQAGTVAEAREAQAIGVDVIVARGGEAGGHGRNDAATLPLLAGILGAVDLPVLAAGGISSPRSLAAVLAAGAEGAWCGTAFLCCPEALTSREAQEALIAADETSTAYGRVFDIAQHLDWPPEFGGRALRNEFFERWNGHEEELAADGQSQRELRDAIQAKDFRTAFIYAGQSVAELTEIRPAADVLRALVEIS